MFKFRIEQSSIRVATGMPHYIHVKWSTLYKLQNFSIPSSFKVLDRLHISKEFIVILVEDVLV